MPAAISVSPTCMATSSTSFWPDKLLLPPLRRIITRRALPKKRCLELSGAQEPGVYWGARVPDTFFWAKPHSLAIRGLRRGVPLQFLFVITLFLSSALLFLIQPMFAKMVLPRFGGTSAVWSTCMVFFQAALLAGYGYAHAAPAKLGVKRHAVLHLIVLLLPPLFLPIVLPEGGTPPGNPILSLLALLAVTVGLPFLVVSASGPLVPQRFAHTSHTAAKDRYFLYAASNLGSMVA